MSKTGQIDRELVARKLPVFKRHQSHLDDPRATRRDPETRTDRTLKTTNYERTFWLIVRDENGIRATYDSIQATMSLSA